MIEMARLASVNCGGLKKLWIMYAWVLGDRFNSKAAKQKLILMVVTILGGAALAFGADRINAAFKAGRDMKAVQREMEKKGTKLNDQDKSTLDFYWKQTPLLKK